MSPQQLAAVVLINVILAVLPQGEAEHVGRGILIAVLLVQRANPFIVHKDHADLGRSFKFFIVQHRVAAAPDQDAQAGRTLTAFCSLLMRTLLDIEGILLCIGSIVSGGKLRPPPFHTL